MCTLDPGSSGGVCLCRSTGCTLAVACWGEALCREGGAKLALVASLSLSLFFSLSTVDCQTHPALSFLSLSGILVSFKHTNVFRGEAPKESAPLGISHSQVPRQRRKIQVFEVPVGRDELLEPNLVPSPTQVYLCLESML